MTDTSRSYLEKIGSFLECATLAERDDFCSLLSLACLGEHYDDRDNEAVKTAFEVLAAFPGRDQFTAMKAKAERCERVESASKALGDTVAEQSVLIDELRARVTELEGELSELAEFLGYATDKLYEDAVYYTHHPERVNLADLEGLHDELSEAADKARHAAQGAK